MSFKTIQNVLPYLCLLAPGMVLSETVEPSVNQAVYSYETRQHETVVVTANRVSRTTNNAISSVKVITREDIVNSQARSVPALLKGLAGVHITQNGGRGSNTSLFLRGTNSDHVIVLVDGIKIGSATSGTASFQHYPLEQIDRIEIVRGPRSSLYGSEALGGVIQIFTKKGYSKPAFNAHMTAGTHDTYELSAGVSGGEEHFFYKASIEGEKTSGIDATRAEAVTKGARYADQKDADGYDNVAGSVHVGVKSDSGSTLSFMALRSNSESDFDGNAQDNSDSQQRIVGLNGMLQLTNDIDVALSISQTEDKSENFIKGKHTSTFDTKRDNVNVQTNIIMFDRDVMTYGLDYQRDEVSSLLSYDETERETFGAFAQYLMALNHHDLEFNIRYDKNEGVNNAFTGGIGYAYHIANDLRLFMSYGTAFKAPSFNELYYPNFGVPTLEPEESATFEAGLRGEQRATQWSLAFFSTKVDELIGYDAAFNQLNIDKASIRGLEFELNRALGRYWHLGVDLSLLSPINESSGMNKHKLLTRRPKVSGRVHISYIEDTWSLGAILAHAGTRYDDAANTKKLKSYKTLDVNAQYALTEALLVQGRIENVFDSRYETAQFYNQPGRGIYVTLRYSTD